MLTRARRRLDEAQALIEELLADHQKLCTENPCTINQRIVSWALNTKMLMRDEEANT